MAKSRERRSKKHNIVSTNKVVIPKAANSILLNRASDIVSAETEVNRSSSQESGFSVFRRQGDVTYLFPKVSVTGLRECNTQSLSDNTLMLPPQSANFILVTFLGLFLDLKKHSRSDCIQSKLYGKKCPTDVHLWFECA